MGDGAWDRCLVLCIFGEAEEMFSCGLICCEDWLSASQLTLDIDSLMEVEKGRAGRKHAETWRETQ